MVAHEGCQPRGPGSKGYDLVNKPHYLNFESDDFWDSASRHLYSHYDIGEGVREVACEVAGEVTKVKQSNLPIKYAGTTRSGGMSRFFRLLNDRALLVT